jgi:hypothetical protein
MDPDDGPGWEQQEDSERRRFDEEHELMKADAENYERWLDEIAAEAAYEQERM